MALGGMFDWEFSGRTAYELESFEPECLIGGLAYFLELVDSRGRQKSWEGPAP